MLDVMTVSGGGLALYRVEHDHNEKRSLWKPCDYQWLIISELRTRGSTDLVGFERQPAVPGRICCFGPLVMHMKGEIVHFPLSAACNWEKHGCFNSVTVPHSTLARPFSFKCDSFINCVINCVIMRTDRLKAESRPASLPTFYLPGVNR